MITNGNFHYHNMKVNLI